MAARRHEGDLDNLFQLPLDEFTGARNALAKQAGPDGAAIKALAKPPLAAWAVNQLYWREREVYEGLIEAAQQLRREHTAVLAGRSADLRVAGRTHDQALDRAVKATLAIVADGGHAASDTTRQAVVLTLRALPVDDAPGRLTRTRQPGGFEMLAGMPIAGGSRIAAPPKISPARQKKGVARPQKGSARDAKALARATAAASAADQALQRAGHEAKREEFERARTAREADKAAAAVERAREALERAQQDLEEAEETAKTAASTRDRAQRRATEADAKAAAARAKAESAAAALQNPER